jgi:hypothetical protein
MGAGRYHAQTIGCETCDNHTQHTYGQSLCPLRNSTSPTCSGQQFANTNLPGGDLLCSSGKPCPSNSSYPTACCDLCGSKPSDVEPRGNCTAWTWSQGKCYLKSSAAGRAAGSGMTSGALSVRSPMEPTIASPLLRTMAPLDGAGPDDAYRYNPWRAPGFAPVVDSCGMAGGRHTSDPGGGDADFEAVPWATMGDLGSRVLAQGQPRAHWTAGDTVEVSWAIRYNQ